MQTRDFHYVKQGSSSMTMTFRVPHQRYLDEFIRLNCAGGLLASRYFRNAKEITTSMAAFAAARKFFKRDLAFGDSEDTTLFVVGGGKTPKTAALFACRSRWDCVAIDPTLPAKPSLFRNVTTIANFVENTKCETKRNMLVVALHSHAPLDSILDNIFSNSVPSYKIRVGLIAIPCCVEQRVAGVPPNIVYDDWGILSPHRQVLVWKMRKLIELRKDIVESEAVPAPESYDELAQA